ncbi:hypothetical protein AAVH_33069, partial [Aphelenchoides avenae]
EEPNSTVPSHLQQSMPDLVAACSEVSQQPPEMQIRTAKSLTDLTEDATMDESGTTMNNEKQTVDDTWSRPSSSGERLASLGRQQKNINVCEWLQKLDLNTIPQPPMDTGYSIGPSSQFSMDPRLNPS